MRQRGLRLLLSFLTGASGIAELDGSKATRRIRERERGTPRHVPILALTAHALKGDRERCLEAGMDGYISKPVQLAALEQAIQEAVQRARGGAGSPA